MTALPPSTDFTAASVTEAQFKTAITALRDYLSGQFGTAGDVATALTTLGALGSSTVAKTAAYTVLAADRGKLITCTNTFTLSLTAAATLGDGFSFAVANIGTGTITIDPNSTELIDGASTASLGAGETCVVVCTGGTAFRTVGKPTANGEFRSQQVFTASGTYTKPAGLKRIKLTVVGGGGGGGGVKLATTSLAGGAGGGGAGGTAIKYIEAASIGATETVTVGAIGSAGSTAGGNGGAGGTSSFGAHCSATGGAGGTGSTGNVICPGGAAGGGSGGNMNFGGGGGLYGFYEIDASGAHLAAIGGGGGSSSFGGGGKPSAGAGSASGAGGAGAMVSGNVTGAAGGAGASGIVIVEEFY